MTEIAADRPSAAGESVAELQPFERWVEAARPKARLWRTVLSVIIVIAVWMMWTTAVLFAYALGVPRWGNSDGRGAVENLMNGATPLATMTLLASFIGLWFGVWLAMRVLHGQRFWTVVSPERKMRWREFGVGVAVIAVYTTLNLTFSFAAGLPLGQRSGLSLAEWAVIAVPICVLVFLQASGEELLFRGYITQQLAARFRHPLIWGFLPSILFGLFHYSNGTFPEYSAYYTVATTLFALAATVSIWRTGSLSMAMGMHTANNVGSFLITGTDDSMNATQLWLWSTDDLMKAAPYDMALLTLLLVFLLSPWAPLPKRQPFALRNETRAAP